MLLIDMDLPAPAVSAGQGRAVAAGDPRGDGVLALRRGGGPAGLRAGVVGYLSKEIEPHELPGPCAGSPPGRR